MRVEYLMTGVHHWIKEAGWLSAFTGESLWLFSALEGTWPDTKYLTSTCQDCLPLPIVEIGYFTKYRHVTALLLLCTFFGHYAHLQTS